MKAEVKPLGRCSLCRMENEGIEIRLFWLFKVFICEGCISLLFRQFKREVQAEYDKRI